MNDRCCIPIRHRLFKKGLVVLGLAGVALLGLDSVSDGAQAPSSSKLRQGMETFKAGNLETAAQLFAEAASGKEGSAGDSNKALAHYNAGTAYLQAGKLDKAERALKNALNTPDEQVQINAYRNQGVLYLSRARSLLERERGNPAAAKNATSNAMAAFENSLRLKPGQPESQKGFETAKRLHRRLQKAEQNSKKRQRQNQKSSAQSQQNRSSRSDSQKNARSKERSSQKQAQNNRNSQQRSPKQDAEPKANPSQQAQNSDNTGRSEPSSKRSNASPDERSPSRNQQARTGEAKKGENASEPSRATRQGRRMTRAEARRLLKSIQQRQNYNRKPLLFGQHRTNGSERSSRQVPEQTW